MHERNQAGKLTGRIEIDDAHLGGERLGKRGRGAEHKFPFIAAVQTDEEGHSQRIQLRRVGGFTLAEFEYCFNRRYGLKAMIPRFLTVAARTPPIPCRLLKMAEPYA